jgi:predicted nucleic acid-binding protein
VPDIDSSLSITSDPDDDKFMLCAHDQGAVIVSGDQHLLDATGWEGVRVMTPHGFLEFLGSPDLG